MPFQTQILAFLIGVAMTAGGALKLHNMDIAAREAEFKQQKALAVGAARTEENAKCDAAAKITQENSHALKAKYDLTLARYYSLLTWGRNPGSAPEASPAGAAGGNHGAAGAAMPALCLSIPDAARYGKLADDQASALITLQDVVAGIYKDAGRADLLPPEYR